MARHRAAAIEVPLLAATGLFGLNSMFGQIYRNGYAEQVLKILDSPSPTLPGSQSPLLARYTGVPPVDRLLAIATILWANVTDGSAPELSLYTFQFSGQLVPVFLAIMIETSRSSSLPGVNAVLWGCAMQSLGYGFTMPVFGIYTLLQTSGKRSTVRDPSLFEPRVLLPSFGLGYFLPAVLMSLPANPVAHQWFGAVWQGFPLYVVGFQHLFGRIMKVTPERGRKSRSLSGAYDMAFKIASAIQLTTYTIILAVKVAPGSFPHWAVTALTFQSVFQPGPAHLREPMESMAKAMHDFFKWDQYVGSAAALTWGLAHYSMALEGKLTVKDWVRLGCDVVRWSAVAGPAGALMRLLELRDLATSSKNKRKGDD
ncbi:hypothetical protein QBC34DRAFT_426103 [Podospora aff. communis PSN243]|uniref:Uncharacterized protein n=1 Tax=Podospora aff. communis PSN243 TaxID=3040156 RepID=A0AAV9GJI0_9PEZI|nr:hypothetical protein QBC34DRAFT_426103 [Podospora aff. communis PSN243]